MQFVKTGLKLKILNLIIISILSLGIAERIKMSAADKQICLGCLNIVKILKNVKNSSVCETINRTSFLNVVGVNLNQIPKNELMCYEIFYYFYFFMPTFISDEEKYDAYNFNGNYNTAKETTSSNDCNVCAYLDKCEYYGCSYLVDIKQEKKKDKIIIENNVNNILLKKNVERNNFPFIKEVNRSEIKMTESNKYHQNEMDYQSKKEKNSKHFNIYEMMLNNAKNLSHHLENKNFSSFILNNHKNITLISSDKSDEISFLAKSVSRNGKVKSKLKQDKDGNQQVDLLNVHLDLTKVKIEHMIDEIINLANIHKAIQEMKKKVLSYLITKKLQSYLPNEINLTPLKIGTQDNLRDYVNDVKVISDKIHFIFEKINGEIIENSHKFYESLDINNINDHDTKNMDISLEYLLSLLQCYNELYLLGNSIYESNIHTVKNIQKLFSNPAPIQTVQKPIETFNDKINTPDSSSLQNNSNLPAPGLEINHLRKLNDNKDINHLNIKKILNHGLEEQENKNSLPIENQNQTQIRKDGKNNMEDVNNDKKKIIVAEINFNESNRTETNIENILARKKNTPENIQPTSENNLNSVQQNRTVEEIPLLDLNKLNETKIFFERLEKLEKEQEKFNLLLKNATLLEAITSKNKNSLQINKKPQDAEEVQEEDDGEEIMDDDLPFNHLGNNSRDSHFYNHHRHRSYGGFTNSQTNLNPALSDFIQRPRKEIVKSHSIIDYPQKRHKFENKESPNELSLSNLSNLELDKTKDYAPRVIFRRPPLPPRRNMKKLNFRK